MLFPVTSFFSINEGCLDLSQICCLVLLWWISVFSLFSVCDALRSVYLMCAVLAPSLDCDQWHKLSTLSHPVLGPHCSPSSHHSPVWLSVTRAGFLQGSHTQPIMLLIEGKLLPTTKIQHHIRSSTAHNYPASLSSDWCVLNSPIVDNANTNQQAKLTTVDSTEYCTLDMSKWDAEAANISTLFIIRQFIRLF